MTPRRRPQPTLTPTQLEEYVAEETGLYDFLTNQTKTPPYIEARAIAYLLAIRDNWSTNRIAHWSGRCWKTVEHSLRTHGPELADEIEELYRNRPGATPTTW